MTEWCVCCGAHFAARDPDPWDGRMNAYCDACATNRCDCYPDACPVKYGRRHSSSERFHAILRELGELHDRKQADYGRGDDPFANVRASEEWGIPGWAGAMLRATDKVRRLQSLLANGKLENESAEDSLRDIAVYTVIALVLYEQDRAAAA